MQNVQVSELDGVALDWAVAKCEKLPIKLDPMGFGSGENGGFWIWDDAPKGVMTQIGVGYSPSKKWEQGGPLIEREKITLSWPNPLAAAMRCYVAKKLGNAIQIPDLFIIRK